MNEFEFQQWVMQCPEERWRISQHLPEGQILRGQEFGDIIYNIACQPAYINYLEIGTWCGRGTTKCFLDGIIPREDGASLQALETNFKFYTITKNYWDKYFQHKRINAQKLNLLFGSVVRYDQLDDNYITDSGHTKDTYDYNIDLKSAPFVTIANNIDVLCLDGGHFSTILEWELFKEQIKVIILDDIKTSKTRKILKEIYDNPVWDVIYSSDNRNGELVAKKVEIEER